MRTVWNAGETILPIWQNLVGRQQVCDRERTPSREFGVEHPKTLPEHVRKRLDDADWKSIYPKLVAHSHCFARSLFWRSGNKKDLAEGQTPESVVNEAIARVYEWRRKWDPEKDPDLFKFLKDSVLSSMFNELAMSVDNTRVDLFRESAEQPGELLEPADLASTDAPHAQHLVRHNPNPEELLIATQCERQAKDILNELLSATADDPEVTAILECAMEGITAPRHISEQTQFPIAKINNAQKRLRLLMKKFSPTS